MGPASPHPPPLPGPQNIAGSKRSFLAWWAAIPAAVFVLVEVRYGWPFSKARVHQPEFVISHFMGGLVGVLLIGLAIGWGAYRLFGRSRLVGTAVFTLIMALASLAVFRRPPPPGSHNGALNAATVTENFPLHGAAFISPPGWQRLPPDRQSIIARWISPESKTGDVRGMIMVEMKKPKILDARQIAAAMAKGWGGQISDTQDQLDGEIAWRISADAKATLEPVEGIICIHEGRVYMIEGGVTSGNSCHDAIETIQRGWKWTTLEPPVKHLEFREQPVVLFNGGASINFPAAMLLTDEEPGKSVFITLVSTQSDRTEFMGFVQFASLQDGDTLAAAEDRLTKGSQAQLKLLETLTWHNVKSATESQADVTQWVPGPSSEGKNWIMWGIAQLPGREIVLINFTAYSEDPDERAIYGKTAERIVGSIARPAH
jgi:hypothetical protein